MIKELSDLDTPPTSLGDFMPPHKIVSKVDDLLYHRLEACLPNISPFLNELPSRESGPQSRLESPRGADEVPLEPSEEAAEGSPDLEFPRETGLEGALEPLRQAVHVHFIGDETPTPANVSTPVVTRRQVLSEEDSNSSMPLPIPYQLKGKGRGMETEPIELSTDDEGSDKENDDDHPGPGWLIYNAKNPKHYIIATEKDDDIHAAKYIQYELTSEGSFIEGCDKKGGEVFRKPLQARSKDARPNLIDNGLIRDNHLHSLAPTSKLRDMVDRHIHSMRDPGLTADVARYCAQTALQEELANTTKALKERLHNNHDDLLGTTHQLIYARVPTHMFRHIFADETPFEANHSSHPYHCPHPLYPCFCYECWEVLPNHRSIDCPKQEQCCFCGHPNHSAPDCEVPHLKCSEINCVMPSWHPNVGTWCSAPPATCIKQLMVNNPDAAKT